MRTHQVLSGSVARLSTRGRGRGPSGGGWESESGWVVVLVVLSRVVEGRKRAAWSSSRVISRTRARVEGGLAVGNKFN